MNIKKKFCFNDHFIHHFIHNSFCPHTTTGRVITIFLPVSGDIEDCLVAPVAQGQFTPLPEALCWAILELTSQRQAATLDTLRSALRNAFPAMQRPSRELVYDALAKLMQERKIYHTSQGYFVVTPETRRLRRDTSNSRRCSREVSGSRGQGSMLMSNDEAMALVHGEMLTLRDGDVTHQAVQTNLADVICGGKKSLSSYDTLRWHISILSSSLIGEILRQQIEIAKKRGNASSLSRGADWNSFERFCSFFFSFLCPIVEEDKSEIRSLNLKSRIKSGYKEENSNRLKSKLHCVNITSWR